MDIRLRGLVRGLRLLVTLFVGNPRAVHTADMGEAWLRCLEDLDDKEVINGG